MMDKFALFVGVSQSEAARVPILRKARTNAAVLKRSLQSTNAGFNVQVMCDAPQLEMAEAIERFFRHRDQDDQLFFLFSGYIFLDTDQQLYLATPETAIDNGFQQLVRARTIPMQFLLNVMDCSLAWRQVIIFDACFRQPQGIEPNASEILLEQWFNQMVGDRRVILTSSTYTQHDPEPEELDTWSYTRYIAEGCATGAADTDYDGILTVKELHYYAQRKLKIAAPSQHPQFYGSEETANQMVLQVPSNAPEVKYRQFLERLTSSEDTEIDRTEFRILTGRNRMNAFRQHLSIPQSRASEIEFEVLRPYQEYQHRKQLFEEYHTLLTEGRYDESW